MEELAEPDGEMDLCAGFNRVAIVQRGRQLTVQGQLERRAHFLRLCQDRRRRVIAGHVEGYVR